MDTADTVAVLGTGIMGAPMARNLLGAGLPVVAWNRTRDKAERLVSAGGRLAETPPEACAAAGVVVTMLSDGETVDAVMLGGGGLDAMAEDAVWLQMSTVGGPWTDRLAAAAGDRGLGFLDAPVLGTKEPAESGDLLVLASGPERLRERCEPVLDAVGRATMWVGAQVGVGSRLKVVVNSWLLGLVGALAEAVALARATDVRPEQFLEAIEGGPVGAPYARIKGTAMIRGSFPPSFPLHHALKDIRLVLDAGESAGVPLAVARAVAQRFAVALDAGHGDEDMAAIYGAYRSGTAGTERPRSFPRASSSPTRSPGTGREKK